MKITAKVIPNASKSEIISINNNEFKIKVQTPPEDGKANKEVIKLLAKHFNTSKSKIKIISVKTTRLKIIEIFDLQDQ